jgi:PAS domain S-box-containing protein
MANSNTASTRNQQVQSNAKDAPDEITSLQSAERSLRESEQKFRSLAEVAPCSIFIHNLQNLLYVNQATSDITGYTREELLSRELWTILHPDSIPLIRERFALRSEGKAVPTRFEAKIVTKEGEQKWVEFNGGSIEYDGKPAVVCVALDITPRRQSDEQLQIGQERFRLAAESAGICSWEWDVRSNRLYWSPAAYRIYGFNSSDEFGGTFESFLAHVHEEDRDMLRKASEAAVSDHEDLNVEFRLQRGDGGWGSAYARAKVFYDPSGQPERMVGVAIDMTATRTAEQAMRESERRFRVTFNQAAVGMVHVALDGSLLMVNQKFCDILGYTEDELMGRRFHLFTHPDDLQSNVERLNQMLAGEVGTYSIEKRYIRKDGFVVWGQVSASIVRDELGEPKYIITVIEDITERKRASDALRQSEKLAATGRLAASIAHEINNPLEAVTNLLYLLEQHKSLDDTARGYAKMAQEEVSRVAHIARQTLGFYRDSSHLESVQVPQLMEDVLDLFERKLRASEIEIEKDFADDITAEVYTGEMRQVLSNLLANALDAIGKKGKIKIRISRSRSWQRRGPRGVRITIADTGTGIDAANKRHIFEPFFTTKGVKGTGLGLWVTRGMIEKHSGSVRVWSSTQAGKSGTAFTIFLPAKQKSEAAKRKIARVN